MDAIYFQYPYLQFDESKVVRELKKCFSGFKIKNEPNHKEENSSAKKYPAVSTGNWGCGAFKGDRQLKCK